MKISPIFNIFNRFNNFKINKFNSNPINLMRNNGVDCFVRSNTVFKGKSFSKRLDEKLDSSQDELVLFLFDELNKKVKELNLKENTKEELVQRKILEILEYLASESDKDKIKEFIIASFRDFRPRKSDTISIYGIESIDSKTSDDDERKIIDKLTEKNLISYLSEPSEEKKRRKKKRTSRSFKKIRFIRRRKTIYCKKIY